MIPTFFNTRLGWVGHIRRMEDERTLKGVLNGKFRNMRPVGKLRTSWKDVFRRDTSQILEIRGWRRRAEDREEWRRLLREVRAQKGLQRPRWDGILQKLLFICI
jgi:hypothetical protein